MNNLFKRSKTFNLLITAFLTSMLLSCSSTPVQTKKANYKRPLSPKEKALDYYRSLRQKEWSNLTKKKSKLRSKYIRVHAPSSKKKISNMPKHLAPIKKKVKIHWVDKEQQSVEIEQNLAFFCMENRKNKKFKGENDCYAFTQNIKIECEDDYQSGDARLTKCVKSRLK